MAAFATEIHTQAKVSFPLNVTTIEPDFSDNRRQIQAIGENIEQLRQTSPDVTDRYIRVVFRGATSLEGSHEINLRLGRERLAVLEEYIRERIDIPDSIVVRDDAYIPWEWLKDEIESLEMPGRDEVLAIIAEEGTLVPYGSGETVDSRVAKLRTLRDGAVWRQLSDKVFPRMRWATASIEIDREALEQALIEATPAPEPEPVPAPEPEVAVVVEPEPEPVVVDQRNFYLKTNFIGWAMAQTNIGVEFDFARHWSVAFSAYYSAWNYFKHTLKFRTTNLRPEVRYWFSPDNQRWFMGVHFGLVWYNYAFNGRYRIQDHDRRTPALGGGLSAGYRMPVSSNGRWFMEFGLSAGAYDLHYDKFINDYNGRRVRNNVHRTYVGLDGVFVTLAYRFSLTRNTEAK